MVPIPTRYINYEVTWYGYQYGCLKYNSIGIGLNQQLVIGVLMNIQFGIAIDATQDQGLSLCKPTCYQQTQK